jgi:hypothetical protein
MKKLTAENAIIKIALEAARDLRLAWGDSES